MGRRRRIRSRINNSIKEARRKGHRMREALEAAIVKVNEKKEGETPKTGYRVQILLDPLMKTAWFVDVEGAGFPTKQEAMERTLEDLKLDSRFTEDDIAKFRKELEAEMK